MTNMSRFVANRLTIFLISTFFSFHISAQQIVPGKFQSADLYADVEKYVNFAIHRTGTEGDNKTSKWIKGTLDKNGFKTEYVAGKNWQMRSNRLLRSSWEKIRFDNRY